MRANLCAAFESSRLASHRALGYMLIGAIGVLAGCAVEVASDGGPRQTPSVESREYRYSDNFIKNHRNLQWRMEQIEAKLDTLNQRLPAR